MRVISKSGISLPSAGASADARRTAPSRSSTARPTSGWLRHGRRTTMRCPAAARTAPGRPGEAHLAGRLQQCAANRLADKAPLRARQHAPSKTALIGGRELCVCVGRLPVHLEQAHRLPHAEVVGRRVVDAIELVERLIHGWTEVRRVRPEELCVAHNRRRASPQGRQIHVSCGRNTPRAASAILPAPMWYSATAKSTLPPSHDRRLLTRRAIAMMARSGTYRSSSVL